MTRKHRTFGASFKARVALAAVRGEKTTAQLADNLGWLRRLVLTLLKQHPGKDSIAMKRRLAG